ncbi:MAG: histidine phosphatase family protein [Synergistaceae bacterium]|nr:histidine phosphatase family protein [Synergistaceae bacterium]
MMKIYLIRHALSTANSRALWTGQSDAGLSRRGIEAQRAMCARFDYPRCELYFSSPLIRCIQSLRLIYGRGADFELPELSECDLGELTGKPYTNLDDDPNYLLWTGSPDRLPPWGGESFAQFRLRAESGFAMLLDICRRMGAESAAAMMHGNVMRAALHRFADGDIEHGLWKIPNGGVYLLDFGESLERARSWSAMPDFLFR